MITKIVQSVLLMKLENESNKHRSNGSLKKIEELTNRIEKNRILFETIFEMLPVAVWVVCPEKESIIIYNRKAYETLGYTDEEFYRMKTSDIDVLKDEKQVKDHIKKVKENKYDEFETKHVKKDGSIILAIVKTSFVEFEDKGIICTVIDYRIGD